MFSSWLLLSSSDGFALTLTDDDITQSTCRIIVCACAVIFSLVSTQILPTVFHFTIAATHTLEQAENSGG